MNQKRETLKSTESLKQIRIEIGLMYNWAVFVLILGACHAFLPVITPLQTRFKKLKENTVYYSKDVRHSKGLLHAEKDKVDHQLDISGKSKDTTKSANDKASTSTPVSFGSYLLERKQIEEDEIEKLKESQSANDVSSEGVVSPQPLPTNLNDISKQVISKTQESKKLKNVIFPENPIVSSYGNFSEWDEALQKFGKDAEETIASFMGSVEGKHRLGSPSEEDSKKESKEKIEKENRKQNKKRSNADPELIRELDESVTILNDSEKSGTWLSDIMKDTQLINVSDTNMIDYYSDEMSRGSDLDSTSILPLSGAEHIERIEVDMRRLATAIASTIETEEQWKTFCEDGGGALPLLECIHDGAREIRIGTVLDNLYDESVVGVVTEKPNAFQHACRASKALRDLCSISKSMSAIVTDGILRTNAAWSKTESERRFLFSWEENSGLFIDFVWLLRYASDADKLYKRAPDAMIPFLAAQQRRGSYPSLVYLIPSIS